MLTKIIKCLLITILIFIGIVLLAMFIELLKTILGATDVMLILFGIIVFGVVFSLVWTTFI